VCTYFSYDDNMSYVYILTCVQISCHLVGMTFETEEVVNSFHRQYGVKRGFGMKARNLRTGLDKKIPALHEQVCLLLVTQVSTKLTQQKDCLSYKKWLSVWQSVWGTSWASMMSIVTTLALQSLSCSLVIGSWASMWNTYFNLMI